MNWTRWILYSVVGVSLFGGACSSTEEPLEDGGVDASVPMDAAPEPDAGPNLCGNGVLDEGEECDDNNRASGDYCSSECRLSCGDGEVSMEIETCDTGIAAGMPGACPETCDDGNACTSDVLSGSECTATCVSAPILACVNDDGCCPSDCNALSDSDCPSVCGNGIFEAGETCGEPDVPACPTSCDDRNACTTDVFTGSASACDAVCTSTPVTSCSLTSDGCCPAGCDDSTDADCSMTCGNAAVDGLETCDDTSSVACPTSCDDGIACTEDVLLGSASTCSAECLNTDISTCSETADECCPSVCNATNDVDCVPVCGNRIVELGEDCDDGDADPTDGCDLCMATVVPTAFVLNALDIRDPHAYTNVSICLDLTSTLNERLSHALTHDDDGDGTLDLSYALIFRPLDQAATMGMLDFDQISCDLMGGTTACSRPSRRTPLATVSYRNQAAGTCLDTLYGGTSVVRPHAPGVDTPIAPCFVSDTSNLTINLSGIVISLRDAQIAGTYVGTPATSITNGLLRGFITRSDAAAITLPSTLPLVGGMNLASLLAGGPSNCSAISDLDTHPTHGEGWWFFLNFGSTTTSFREF